jgi:hypothetical protein
VLIACQQPGDALLNHDARCPVCSSACRLFNPIIDLHKAGCWSEAYNNKILFVPLLCIYPIVVNFYIFRAKMANIFAGQYRILVLILSTLCVSIMQSNFLTLNFTIICMTEEHYRWDEFTINFGIGMLANNPIISPAFRHFPTSQFRSSTTKT